PLQLNLPRASVRDLNMHGSDLIAATHGRAMWVLDDISPLRQLTDSVRGSAVHLFSPDTVIRFAGGHARAEGVGETPPDGLIVDYWLKDPVAPKDSAVLEFLDGSGKVIRRFSSERPKAPAKSAADQRPEVADT